VTDPYLILHKVRDEPVFDIAEPASFEAGAWIVSTSGWRAYPLAVWPLNAILDPAILKVAEHGRSLAEWQGTRDHYVAVPVAPPTLKRALKNLSQEDLNEILAAIKELSHD
jgi:hypothetical protein